MLHFGDTVHHSVTEIEVHERLGRPEAALVSIVDVLESAGWVVRDRDERDRRRHLLRLTDEGQRRIEERAAMGEEMLGTFLEPLDDAEREQLNDMLLRLLAHQEWLAALEGA